MPNMNWRARLVSNLSSWLVQEGPLEQVGCECCTELNCTTENYQICEQRLTAYARAKSERMSDRPPESTIRIKADADGRDGRDGRDGTDD
jgi:hypothetical protein